MRFLYNWMSRQVSKAVRMAEPTSTVVMNSAKAANTMIPSDISRSAIVDYLHKGDEMSTLNEDKTVLVLLGKQRGDVLGLGVEVVRVFGDSETNPLGVAVRTDYPSSVSTRIGFRDANSIACDRTSLVQLT